MCWDWWWELRGLWSFTRRLGLVGDDATDEVWCSGTKCRHQVVQLLLFFYPTTKRTSVVSAHLFGHFFLQTRRPSEREQRLGFVFDGGIKGGKEWRRMEEIYYFDIIPGDFVSLGMMQRMK